MASTRQIKSRIRSVSSNRQITKAMELVAASKLRRAQSATAATRPYSEAAIELLSALSGLTDVYDTPLYRERDVKARLVVLITSDRGLAGAYNTNAIRQFMRLRAKDANDKVDTRVIAIGKKGAQFVSRIKGVTTEAVYPLPEQPTAQDIRPILKVIVDSFTYGSVDAVDIVTTWYENSLNQKAVSIPLLPAGFEATEEVSHQVSSASFEPSVGEVLNYATVRLLEAQLLQALLDALASEHSMRRMAMKNASDNARDIIDDLTLEMNKVRQAGITQELSEISAGVEAMK